MINIVLINLAVLLILTNAQQIIKSHNVKKQKIAFGSCNKFYRSQKADIFYDVAKQNPDVWIWLGDIGYLDNMYAIGFWVPETNYESAKQKLSYTKNDQAYQEMLKKVNAEIGVWDDHDYGKNDSGQSFKYKDTLRKAMMDFFNEPQDSERRTRDSGIYTSYYLGESKRIKIILTDGRYNRTPDDMLGQKQWDWLEKEFNDSQVEIFIFGTGTQFLPDDRFLPEHWNLQSREKLYQIINKTKASVLFISGDLHYAEMMEHPCSQQKIGYKLVEFTSSGLSFYFDAFVPGQFNFTTEFLFTNTYNDRKDRFNGRNFGIIEIEWDEQNLNSTQIRLQAYTIGLDKPVLERVYRLQEFQKSAQNSTDYCVVDEISPFNRWKTYVLNNIKNIFLEFKIGVIAHIIIIILLIKLIFTYYKYLIYMVFFYEHKEKQD